MSQDPPQNVPVQQNVAALLGGAVIPVEAAPNDRIVLDEFVEIVDRGGNWGVVKDPGPESSEENRQTLETRTDKNGNNYKQYINLDKDVDGEDHRHPEYGQYITFRARVKWEDADRNESNESLQGKLVFFTYTRKNGKGRPSQLANNNQKDGFGDSLDGVKSAPTTPQGYETEENGWTPVIKFYLSRYGGDEFEIHAQAEEEAGQGASGKKLTIGSYEVWRKFWYQVTRPTTIDAPNLDRAVAGWAKVKADMVKTDEVTYAPGDDDVAHGTFYPEWQFKGGTSDAQIAATGPHNYEFLYGMLRNEDAKPVKAHVILCYLQCDRTLSEIVWTGWRTEHEFDHSVPVKNRGIVLHPRPSLLQMMDHTGTYEVQVKPARSPRLTGITPEVVDTGVLGPDNFTVVKGRRGVNHVHITLPFGVPGANQQVRVKFKAQYVQTYLGESNGYQTMCSVKDGSNELNATVVHEIGHAFWQVPRKGEKAPGLKEHPQFIESSGPHCNSGIPWFHTCVMYTTGHWKKKATFCNECHTYVRLKDMHKIKDKKN